MINESEEIIIYASLVGFTPESIFFRNVMHVFFFKRVYKDENGGGGIRTPVPRCFKASVYMLSRFIVFFTLPNAITTGFRLGYFGKVSPCRPEQPTQPACCLTPLPNPQAKSGRTSRHLRQPCATVNCRLKFIAG